MRVFALDPDLMRYLRFKCRKLGLRKVLTAKPATARCVILLSDGTPDDIALTIVCAALDGEEVAALVKPTEKRFGAIPFIRTLLQIFPEMARLLFVIDQETSKVDEIYEQLNDKLGEHGFAILSKRGNIRWRLYNCRLGGRGLRVCVVVNGLDNIPCGKHAIEDHFLEAARSVFRELPTEVSRALEGPDCDPKEAWKALGEENQAKVLKELARSKGLVRETFPQHTSALGGLEEV